MARKQPDAAKRERMLKHARTRLDRLVASGASAKKVNAAYVKYNKRRRQLRLGRP